MESQFNIDALNFALEHGIIDMTGVLESTNEMRKQEILKEHGNLIKQYGHGKEKYWYFRIPDSTQESGCFRRRSKNREHIESELCSYYMQLEKQQQKVDTEKRTTFEELFFEFMECKKNEVESGTIRRMMIDWNKFYKTHPEFIHKPFREITRIDVDNFLNDIVNQTPIKDKAFCNMRGIIKQTFEYALDAEYIDKSPYRVKVNKKKIIPTRKKPSEQEVYSQEEKTLLLAELERRLSNNPYHIVALAIMLEFELGTRRAEILAISNSDIKDDKVHICKQIVDEYDVSDLSKPKLTGYKVVDYTKTRDGDRYLPLTAKAKSIISRIQRINMETGESYKDFLFVQNGYLINPNKLYDLIKDACGCINIPIKATHRIRKTYASTLYNNGNGVDISTVKDMLGHADERTTISHYIFSTSDSKTRDEKVLDALQGNTTSSNKSSESVTNGDKNIIHFQEIKKRKTPSKLRVFH